MQVSQGPHYICFNDSMVLSASRSMLTQCRLIITLALLLVPQVALAQSKATLELADRMYALYGAGKYSDALPLAEALVQRVEREVGRSDARVLATLGTLGELYQLLGRDADAERILKDLVRRSEQALGATSLEHANHLGALANLYQGRRRDDEAEALYRRSLAIVERIKGPDHPSLATTLNNLAIIYTDRRRFEEADALLLRAIALKEKQHGPDHLSIAPSLAGLANSYLSQGRFAEAESLFQRSLQIREKSLGPEHPELLGTLANLARLYTSSARLADAETMSKRSLQVISKAFGEQHPDFGLVLNNLGVIYVRQKRHAEARDVYRRALAIRQTTLPPEHPEIAQTLGNIGLLEREQKQWPAALDALRAAVAIRSSRLDTAARNERTAYTVNNVFYDFADAAWGASSGKPEQNEALTSEVFEVLQRALQPSAGAALTQMAVRAATKSPELAARVRERQDLIAQRDAVDKSLLAALSQPANRRDQSRLNEQRRAASAIEARLKELGAAIATAFPSYTDLASTKPVSVVDVQRLLAADEGLLSLSVAPGGAVHALAITVDNVLWRKLDTHEKDLTARIASLRAGLDHDDLKRAAAERKLFDLGLAHDLYEALLAPVAALLKPKRHLIVVPSGPLTSLPFHLLVTEKPPVARPDNQTIGAYAKAAWLSRRHAVSVLPSVSSLKALRAVAKLGSAPKPLIAFGDPVFQAKATPADSNSRRPSPRVRAASDYFKGSRADLDTLRQGLIQLPETRDELEAVARSLNADQRELRLGIMASEATVKSLDLSAYRIVYFATHGLVAGELKGLAEPALALTLPPQATELDDGLLTASEITQLKLNADWVILSACNTAAGETTGADALSGLARAFFYAGARALLVSHWRVETDAAVRLATTTFAELQKDPSLGRARALQKAMLAMIDDGGSPWNAYPDNWAAFSIVGEGGR